MAQAAVAVWARFTGMFYCQIYVFVQKRSRGEPRVFVSSELGVSVTRHACACLRVFMV